jgi:hypothetical protein
MNRICWERIFNPAVSVQRTVLNIISKIKKAAVLPMISNVKGDFGLKQYMPRRPTVWTITSRRMND